MKHYIKYLLIVMCLLFIYISFGAFTNASPTLVLKNGASLRTTGERQGIRFISTIDTLKNVDEHGYLISKGEHSFDEMMSIGSKYEVKGDCLTFSLVVYGMSTAEEYLSDLTVISYYRISDKTYYSDVVTRNIAEVALSAKNSGNKSDLVENVVTTVNKDYKKVGWNENGNYEISSLLETNTDYLEKEFIEDLNDYYDTKLTTDSSYEDYQKVLESKDKNDLTESIIYKFFVSNDETSSKWTWLINFIDSKASGHVKNQTNALINKKVVYDSNIHKYELWYARHLSLTLCNFFNRGSYTSYSTVPFDSASDYDDIENYCIIYANLNNYDLVKVGEKIILPEEVSKEGYEFLGYKADLLYDAESSYNVLNEDVEFVPTYNLVKYNIKYFFDGNEITGLSSSYTIEDEDLQLPIYYLDGYNFIGWYEDSLFECEKIYVLPSGSTNEKVYYAKMEKTSNVAVDVTYDLNGGMWSKETMVKYSDPLNEFTLTQYLSYTSNGYESSLYSTPKMVYWYYIPIKETNIDGVYEIIEIVYQSANVTAKDYDYLITWHSALQDKESYNELDLIYDNASSYIGDYVIFDKIPESSGSCKISCVVYDSNVFEKSLTMKLIEPVDLLVPFKVDDEFIGWLNNIDNEIYLTFPGYYENFGHIIYTAKWESETTGSKKIDDTITYLDSLFVNSYSFDSNINLPDYYEITGCDISWSSSNINILTNEGVYNRPYRDTVIELVATITNGNEKGVVTFDLTAIGYKDLTGTIASSYSYTNYSLTSDLYFDVMDIINCAFATGKADGSITIGSTLKNNINNYIMPRAREEGCWVLMTIGPSSEWETICNPDNNLLDTFADNIVAAINKYGFDGVDLDWECPTSSQKEWFTNLVKVVQEKVKANNPSHLVTASIGGGKWQPPLYDLTNSAQYLDYINMMCYSMTNKAGQYQSALYKNSSYNDSVNKVGYTLTSCSIDESVDIYKSYNVPLNKIIIGFPAYAIKQTRTNNDGVWSSFTFSNNIWYTDLTNDYLNNSNYTYIYDERCQVPYLLSTDGSEFISFDDPKSVSAKCAYAISEGLAGVFYWQNGQDTTGDLVGAMKTSLNK